MSDCQDDSYVMVRIKRRWVPEWLFRMLSPIANHQPFKSLLTRRLSEFEDRRFNGLKTWHQPASEDPEGDKK